MEKIRDIILENVSLFVHRVPHSGCSVLGEHKLRVIDINGMLNSIDIKHIGSRGGAVEQGDLSCWMMVWWPWTRQETRVIEGVRN